VRGAEPADAAAIADVHIRTWQVAYAHVFPADNLARLEDQRVQRERFWRDAIENPIPRRDLLVAEQRDRVVGFVSVGPERSENRLGELYAIYVLPDAWGSGAGAALMQEALVRLRASFEDAILWVLEDNPRARAFYERFGWRVDGGTREETFLETPVREVRYRVPL
jgi:ribosomal protein S18 acetylase RimI-like enzyme